MAYRQKQLYLPFWPEGEAEDMRNNIRYFNKRRRKCLARSQEETSTNAAPPATSDETPGEPKA